MIPDDRDFGGMLGIGVVGERREVDDVTGADAVAEREGFVGSVGDRHRHAGPLIVSARGSKPGRKLISCTRCLARRIAVPAAMRGGSLNFTLIGFTGDSFPDVSKFFAGSARPDASPGGMSAGGTTVTVTGTATPAWMSEKA